MSLLEEAREAPEMPGSNEWGPSTFDPDPIVEISVEARDALLAVVDAAAAYQEEMQKVAYEWRLDWSDFDGRILRDQELDAARALLAALEVVNRQP